MIRDIDDPTETEPEKGSNAFFAGRPQRPPDDLARPTIPNYELIRPLGRGGFGVVWMARSLTSVYRAIKVMPRTVETEIEFEGLCNLETLEQHHDAVVQIRDVGKTDEVIYYVMELADGYPKAPTFSTDDYEPRTLQSDLERRGSLPLGEALAVTQCILDGLGYLHRSNLLHRDIKPANVVFVGGRPKIADIGLVVKASQVANVALTPLYSPPGGVIDRGGDLFCVGRMLAHVATGLAPDELEERVSELDHGQRQAWELLTPVLARACCPEPRNRFRTAEEFGRALQPLGAPVDSTTIMALPSDQPAEVATEAIASTTPAQTQQVALCYRRGAQPDEYVLGVLRDGLDAAGFDVFIDRHLKVGVDWARELEGRIRGSDAVIPLLSSASISSEMLNYEVQLANSAAQENAGTPRLLPVRIDYRGGLPPDLHSILGHLQYSMWKSPNDDANLLAGLLEALRAPGVASAPSSQLESVGGAMPLDSQFYIVRDTDRDFHDALARGDATILIKGARQMGKTSLLARGLEIARKSGRRVAVIDLQKLDGEQLASPKEFFLALGEFLEDQVELDVSLESEWRDRSSANVNFERYLRRRVLAANQRPLLLALDEVDRLFSCPFGTDVFGLFRSWHNERALDPAGPWSRFSLAMAYATEAHLFITDINQSPFNVGTRIVLEDFDAEQVRELDRRYGHPLGDDAALERFMALVMGQPFLTRRGLQEMSQREFSVDEFAATADRAEGPFGDHLKRILVLLARDPQLSDDVVGLLRGARGLSEASFYRLRSAGLLAGDAADSAHIRCRIYESFLRRHLS